MTNMEYEERDANEREIRFLKEEVKRLEKSRMDVINQWDARLQRLRRLTQALEEELK